MIAIQIATFFCLGCLEDKPVSQQSPDPRYCQGCCDFLVKEAEMNPGQSGDWKPKLGKEDKSEDSRQEILSPTNAFVEPMPACPKSQEGTSLPIGRPRAEIPIDQALKLHAEGESIRTIVENLKAGGLKASRMTVQRILAGKRD